MFSSIAKQSRIVHPYFSCVGCIYRLVQRLTVVCVCVCVCDLETLRVRQLRLELGFVPHPRKVNLL